MTDSDEIVIDCDHPLNAIKANPWNKVVQCHQCGHVFERLEGLEEWEMEPDADRRVW